MERFNKFIIVVPSVAIREGTLKNIEITREHFKALYNNKTDSVEVVVGDEFIGVIFKDTEDGETTYHFEMAILEMDLPPASAVVKK